MNWTSFLQQTETTDYNSPINWEQILTTMTVVENWILQPDWRLWSYTLSPTPVLAPQPNGHGPLADSSIRSIYSTGINTFNIFSAAVHVFDETLNPGCMQQTKIRNVQPPSITDWEDSYLFYIAHANLTLFSLINSCTVFISLSQILCTVITVVIEN